jgi:hypothetical protein
VKTHGIKKIFTKNHDSLFPGKRKDFSMKTGKILSSVKQDEKADF